MKERLLTVILATVFISGSAVIYAQDDSPRRPDPEGADEPRRGGERERGGPPQRGAERGGPPQRGGDRPRFVPPIIAALDRNEDGLISAEEIADASVSLKKLDKNKDGKITMDELRPEGLRGQGQGRPDFRGQGGQRPSQEQPNFRRDGPQRPGPGREAGNGDDRRPQVEGGRGQRPALRQGENPQRSRRPQLEEDR